MTAAETLRAASARLRELTADIGHVPTPWIQQPYPAKQGVLTAPGEETPILMAFWGSVSEYAAAMNPAVGLALSNWLDQAADAFEGVECPDDEPALVLARLINPKETHDA